MSVALTVPWGSLDVVLEPQGPVLNYNGTGEFVLLGETNYEFAFPDMRTTGNLTIEGESLRVAGRSWLDRQWGWTSEMPSRRWTWMNLNSPNGDASAGSFRLGTFPRL
ncbi:uncharacterized protein SOCE26_060070 [Sorangium cellulosum]|uniref:AttH domain-containing protein n=2 Tax=Sorangium cellulosum TaxID=56 RepID=A0A2L0EZ18_SORCE|nr:uncharacterized protein SOCE26_060070 [Sorangium cellulosum]